MANVPKVTVQWFTQEEQTLVITIFQAFFGLAGAIANLLGFGFYHVVGKDPLYGWQWMTVCIALISFVATGELWSAPLAGVSNLHSP